MPRQEALELTRRVLAHFENDTLDTANDVWLEPRSAFVDSDRWKADVEMLRSVPQVVGWIGEVSAPGAYTTKTVMGVPVVLARGKDNVLRAFVNGCAHRGAQVAAGCGKTRVFTCLYHGWTYGLDGRIVGAPARKMFTGADLDRRGLRPLPVSEQAGLIVVGLSGEVDVSGALDDVDTALSQYDFPHVHRAETRRFDLSTNWKLAIDVNFEGYHFPYVHADTLDPIASNNSVYDTYGRHLRWAFPFRDIVKYRDVPTDNWPDDFFGTVVYGLFPNVVLIQSPGSSQMVRVYPGENSGASVVYVSFGVSTTIDTDEKRRSCTELMDKVCRILDEQDFPMAEACQRGLEAGVDHVVFGRNERVLHHLASVWRSALVDSTPVRAEVPA